MLKNIETTFNRIRNKIPLFKKDTDLLKRLSFNKEVYNTVFNKLKKDIPYVPKSALIFHINLPFQLPFKDGAIFDIHFGDKSSIYLFSKFQFVVNESIFENEKGLIQHTFRTRVEMVLVSPEDLSKASNSDIFNFFNHLLQRLNIYIESYIVFFEDFNARTVSHLNISSLLSYYVIDLDNWLLTKNETTFVHNKSHRIMLNLPKDIFNGIHAIGNEMIIKRNLFLRSKTLYALSKSHLNNGNFVESILVCQMCIESFIRVVYHWVLSQQGINEDEINTIIEETPFMTLIKSKMPEILGGNWSLSNGGVTDKWHSILYKKRNAIIHGKFDPNPMDAFDAFMSGFNFLAFLQKQLNRNKKKYPELWEEFDYLPEFYLSGTELTLEECDGVE